jgi:hypothetical protein
MVPLVVRLPDRQLKPLPRLGRFVQVQLLPENVGASKRSKTSPPTSALPESVSVPPAEQLPAVFVILPFERVLGFVLTTRIASVPPKLKLAPVLEFELQFKVPPLLTVSAPHDSANTAVGFFPFGYPVSAAYPTGLPNHKLSEITAAPLASA